MLAVSIHIFHVRRLCSVLPINGVTTSVFLKVRTQESVHYDAKQEIKCCKNKNSNATLNLTWASTIS